MAGELHDALADWALDGERRRSEAAEAGTNTLTPYERRLVREAAVMGYVRGSLAAGGIPREEYPGDSAVVADVMYACTTSAAGSAYALLDAAMCGNRAWLDGVRTHLDGDPTARYRAAWRSARRRAANRSDDLGRYETLVIEMARDLDEALSVESYPTLAWIYSTEDMTEDYQGWRRPVWLGSDEQSGRGWRTLAVRVPGRRYVIVRLWPLRGAS